MKTKHIIILVLVIIAIIVIVINWKKWFGIQDTKPVPANGTPCIIGRGGDFVQQIPGTIQNGICTANPVPIQGYQYDASEKKCYRIYADGRTWVNDEECRSRGLI